MTTMTRRVTRPAAPTPADWHASATCATVDPELFYPTGPGGTAAQMEKQAKSICAVCPVRQECLDEAVAVGDVSGIRGGLTASERRGMIRGGGDVALVLCLEAQEFIEARIAAKVPRRDIAAQVGVSYGTIRRAVSFFEAERQELTA
ncbi:WhiB family transcriptional regulator [Streptomyces sp. NPDC005548]|uniref:WhiB family transcriptional regulator n=1 Tax=Streptomyces sp. NPDC005548 TaxID=3364724 RepID=UPI0036D1E796